MYFPPVLKAKLKMGPWWPFPLRILEENLFPCLSKIPEASHILGSCSVLHCQSQEHSIFIFCVCLSVAVSHYVPSCVSSCISPSSSSPPFISSSLPPSYEIVCLSPGPTGPVLDHFLIKDTFSGHIRKTPFTVGHGIFTSREWRMWCRWKPLCHWSQWPLIIFVISHPFIDNIKLSPDAQKLQSGRHCWFQIEFNRIQKTVNILRSSNYWKFSTAQSFKGERWLLNFSMSSSEAEMQQRWFPPVLVTIDNSSCPSLFLSCTHRYTTWHSCRWSQKSLVSASPALQVSRHPCLSVPRDCWPFYIGNDSSSNSNLCCWIVDILLASHLA